MAGGKMSSSFGGDSVTAKPVVVGRGDSVVGSPGTSSVTVKGNSDSAGKIWGANSCTGMRPTNSVESV